MLGGKVENSKRLLMIDLKFCVKLTWKVITNQDMLCRIIPNNALATQENGIISYKSDQSTGLACINYIFLSKNCWQFFFISWGFLLKKTWRKQNDIIELKPPVFKATQQNGNKPWKLRNLLVNLTHLKKLVPGLKSALFICKDFFLFQ